MNTTNRCLMCGGDLRIHAGAGFADYVCENNPECTFRIPVPFKTPKIVIHHEEWRFKAACHAMSGLLANADGTSRHYDIQTIVSDSMKLADALIERFSK